MGWHSRVVGGGLNASAWVFFALSLAIPSGYSYGSVGLLLFALLGAGILFRQQLPRLTWWLIALFVLMGLLWAMKFDGFGTWTGSDYLLKYWLAALTLAIVTLWGVRPAVGCERRGCECIRDCSLPVCGVGLG